MRTNLPIGKVVSPQEWERIVAEHYSEENQQIRMNETSRFIVAHCLANIANQSAVFRGIWGYLDVDKKHLRVFKSNLKKSLEKELKAYGRVKIYSSDINSEVELKIVWN